MVNEEPKNVYVSKWVYLKDWFNYGNNGKLRKILGVIGVLLETLLCKIIVLLLFLISYLCYYASILVQYVFSLFGSLVLIHHLLKPLLF